ncbi:MAG: cryptochrome/photolyase family protein [Egibacteraceae bacterium]
MRTAVVVFTRDLRVHDHPALAAACEEAERVVPLFVFDDAALARPITGANKAAFLLDCVRDLASTMRDMGGTLVMRRGAWRDEVAAVAAEVGASAVFCSDDVSAFARARLGALREAIAPVEVRAFPGVTVVPPGALRTTSGAHYKVFTPYWRRWCESDHRRPLPPPSRLAVPPALRAGSTPPLCSLAGGEVSPELPAGGETAARALLDAWVDGPVGGYDEGHDDLAGDATSRLSPHLHLGCLSPAEVAATVAEGDVGASPGARAFLRQLCWRDFYHQLLAASPEASWRDWRAQGDDWAANDQHLLAWKEGRTGYPIVDAGMRQLAREGWMHNRARLIVASFLTRDLYLDWRAGAAHFLDLLVDGDIANNQLNWQWVAGTGPTSRRNRVLNPLRQAERYDPRGDYVRRYVPELRGIEGPAVHRPWELPAPTRAALGYPDPIVDHDEAVEAFLKARGKRP